MAWKFERAGCRVKDNKHLICKVSIGHIGEAEINERGHLIAAAPDLLELVIQYRNDLKRPPTGDSRERRLEAIEAALAKVEAQS